MRRLDVITYAMDVNFGKLGDGEGQGGLAGCSPWGRRESVGYVWETEQSRGPASSESPSLSCEPQEGLISFPFICRFFVPWNTILTAEKSFNFIFITHSL